MTKLTYAIPITMISFIINITLLFKIFGEGMWIEYFFYIFIGVSLSILVFNFLFTVSISSLMFSLFSVIIGVGILIYIYPFFIDTIIPGIYLSIETAFLISMQNNNITEQKELQNNATSNARKEQHPAIHDFKNGLKNGEICKKYNMKPYQVTRLIQKWENESK